MPWDSTIKETSTDAELAAIVVSRSRYLVTRAWSELLKRNNVSAQVWHFIATQCNNKAKRQAAVLRLTQMSDVPKSILADAAKHAGVALRNSILPQVL